MNIRHMGKDIFVIGFALFSMFFGAGNVIFPPYLGLESGSQWFLGFICYYIADIGLALVALFAIMRRGSTEAIVNRIGKIPSIILMSAIVLCIGPMLAIPRTAASTYEMSLQPLISGISAPVFSIIFFAVIFLLCVRESAVIVKGVINPIGSVPSEPKIDNVPATGIAAGYHARTHPKQLDLPHRRSGCTDFQFSDHAESLYVSASVVSGHAAAELSGIRLDSSGGGRRSDRNFYSLQKRFPCGTEGMKTVTIIRFPAPSGPWHQNRQILTPGASFSYRQSITGHTI